MPHYQIYLVEDEKNLAQVLKSYMENEGWHVTMFHDGESALKHVHDDVHLWVLDIMLPGIDGYQLIKEIKAEKDVPVIFISARDQDLDRILGLELGSDDYLAKPFSPKELVIRAKKLFNRIFENASMPKAYEVSGYQIDVFKRKVTDNNNDEEVELTTKEMDMLLYLLDHLGETKSREAILKAVWGEDYFGSDRAVDDVIRRVRKKMSRLDLETMYGSGYRIASYDRS
ncbi:MAG TPA: response regulator transcription factor [Bacillales bacterium]|nr:response regulator transcription factor [Bacillales bacterium]